MERPTNTFKDFLDLAPGFELKYCDSGCMMQTLPPSQKIMIPKYNTVSYSKQRNKTFILLLLKTISMCMCHVL